MLDKLRTFLRESAGSPRVTQNLPDERVAVAAVLLEVAEADRDVAPEEVTEIRAQLRGYFDLDGEQVESLLALTRQVRERSTDLFPFTNAIARQFTPERKLDVLTMVWQVILADDKLDPYEDQLARRLQAMLSVNHSVLMAAKAKAREAQRERTAT